MAKFGIFCLPLTSHQNAILPLGAELIRRGHEVTVIGIPDLREKALRAGLAVETIAENEIPAGSMREHAKHSGSSSRFAFLKMAFGSSGFTELMLAYAPAVVRKLSLDFLIVDQSHYEGGRIAESCGIRFATVASDVPQLTDYAVPPLIFGWDYSPDLLGQLRNRAAYAAFHRLSKPVRQKINEFRRQSGLAPHRILTTFFQRRSTFLKCRRIWIFPAGKDRGFTTLGRFIRTKPGSRSSSLTIGSMTDRWSTAVMAAS